VGSIDQVKSGGLGVNNFSAAGNALIWGQLRIREGGASPTFYTRFQGDDQLADITYTLPAAQGAASTCLTNNGSGTLSWGACGGGGTPGGANTQVQFNDSGIFGGDAGFVYNKTTDTATLGTLNLTNALAASYGGTGQSSYTIGDILYASSANTLSKLAAGTSGNFLKSNGPGTAPSWAAAGGTGTVTSVAAGTGLTASPSPITTTGTLSLTNPTKTCGAGTAIQSFDLGVATAPTCIAVGGAGGFTCSPSCTTSYQSKFTGASTIGDSLIYDNGTQVAIGTNSPDSNYSLTIDSTAATEYGLKVVTNTALSTTPAVYITNNTGYGLIVDSGNVGIGDTTPLSLFTVGNGDLFQVDSSGNIVKIRNVTYSWPSVQGAATTCLTNDGSGTLSWGACGGGGGLWTDQGTYIYPNNYTSLAITDTGYLGVGVVSPDTNYKITTSGGGIKAESTTQPAGYFSSSSGYGLIVNSGNVALEQQIQGQTNLKLPVIQRLLVI